MAFETEKTEKNILCLKPNVFWLGKVSLLNDFSGEMIYSVMPVFLTVVFGAPYFCFYIFCARENPRFCYNNKVSIY